MPYYSHFHNTPPPSPNPHPPSPFPCTQTQPCQLDQDHLQTIFSAEIFEKYMAVHNFALRLSERGDRGNAEAIQGVLKVLEGKGRDWLVAATG